MGDLVRAIRDRLAERAHDEWCNRVHGNGAPCDCPYGDAPAAIRAVLDLHKPVPNAYDPAVSCCPTCFRPGNPDLLELAAYPCATVWAVAAALGCGEQT